MVGCDAEAATGKGGNEAAGAEEQLENCDTKGQKVMSDNIDTMARIEREIEKRVDASKSVQELAA